MTDEYYACTSSTMAEIKSELSGKSPREIAEISQRSKQKNYSERQKTSEKSGKLPSGNGSGGNLDR